MNFLFDGKMYNAYQVLGTNLIKNEEDLKRAYRKRSTECHPDLHPEKDIREFQILNQANEIVLKKLKEQKVQTKNFQGPPTVSGNPTEKENVNLNDNFLQLQITQARNNLIKKAKEIQKEKDNSNSKVKIILNEYYILFFEIITRYSELLNDISNKKIQTEEIIQRQKEIQHALKGHINRLNEKHLSIVTSDKYINQLICNVNTIKYSEMLTDFINVEVKVRKFINNMILKRSLNRSQEYVNYVNSVIIDVLKEKLNSGQITFYELNEDSVKDIIREGKKTIKKH